MLLVLAPRMMHFTTESWGIAIPFRFCYELFAWVRVQSKIRQLVINRLILIDLEQFYNILLLIKLGWVDWCRLYVRIRSVLFNRREMRLFECARYTVLVVVSTRAAEFEMLDFCVLIVIISLDWLDQFVNPAHLDVTHTYFNLGFLLKCLKSRWTASI